MRSRRGRALALGLVAAVLSHAPARAAQVAPVAARHAMVASTSEIASRIGVAVLERGGTAVDAAVAVGFALAVVWPSAGNVGGGGFMLVRRGDGESVVVDYRERAPAAARRDMYLDANGKVVPDASSEGARSVGVPGTVAGFALAHARFGKLPWADLVEPARRLAAEGFVVDGALARTFEDGAARLGKFDETRRVFWRDGRPPLVGDRLVQPDLATTLGRIAKAGPADFYEGETGRRIAADQAEHGGVITLRDLAAYRPTMRAPLVGHYRGYEVVTMPPPSSGGILLLQMLGMLERRDVARLGFHSVDELHLLVEVMRRAFADRGALLGDSDFVRVPVAGLLAPDYIASRERTIADDRATPSSAIRAGTPAAFEKPETTHFVIVDAAGDAVSNTFTLNGLFGSGMVARGTGVLLNDEMDDFAAAPGTPNSFGLIQGEANAIAPGKRPLSTMTPTMLVKDGRLRIALGSPGGPTIVNTVLQIVVNVVDFGMNLREAIDASRIHHQYLPDEIVTEPYGMTREIRAGLLARGHVFGRKSIYLGDAQAVEIGPGGVRLGASDPRFGGVPVGY